AHSHSLGGAHTHTVGAHSHSLSGAHTHTFNTEQ
ncbi:phage tail protein, partial [Escherichia coli]